jgi:hypothetical protein
LEENDMKWGRLVTLALFVSGCGHASPAAPASEAEPSSGAEADRSSDSLSVAGLHGTLSQEEIQNALEPRMPKFARCVQKRSSSVEWVSGGVGFQFKIAVDGKVAEVFIDKSDMGDRETERCMVEVAQATRFPAPHGGDAEFSWSLEVPLDPDVRPPVAWSAADAGELIAQRGPELSAQCGPGPYALTAYVDVEGKVVAVGGAAAESAKYAQLDCVTQAVSGWLFPSPGSYAAKLSFQVD